MGEFIIDKFYLFFEGIMLYQVVFFGMTYFISKRKDALYYALLNLVSGAYFFLNAPDTFLGIDEDIVFNSPYYLYINFAIFSSMFFMYLIFLKEIFSDTVEQNQSVKKIYTATFYAIPILYFLFVIFALAGWNYNIIFYTSHLINGPFCTLILILNFRKKGYKSLIINGMLVIFVCVVTTVILTVRYNSGSNETVLDKYPLFIIKVGMLIDIALFQLALLKRWNNQENELAVEKIQTQLAVEKLRNKISGELHDDFGSTLSGIVMYSHLAKEQIHHQQNTAIINSLNVIQTNAGEMVNKLNDIVWLINPDNDSLQKVMQRLEDYAIQIAAAKNIRVRSNFNEYNSESTLSAQTRRNIYLLFKEAINNAVKYSNATLVELNIKKESTSILIAVSDNGNGFNTDIIKSGNGLNNMKLRAKEMQTDCIIKSIKGEGTTICVAVKLP